MPWNYLPTDRQRQRWDEFELPAARIASDLADLQRMFLAAVDSRPASAQAAPRGLREKPALVRVRRDQASLSQAERQAFKNAVQALVEDGTYDALVRLRADLTHNMFGFLGAKGMHRFLPWHRRYLWEFESQLERVDRRLRPGELPLALPYWNWPDPFPNWLIDFLPLGRPGAQTAHEPGNRNSSGAGFSDGRSSRVDASHATRSLARAALKPTHDDVWRIVHGFTEQLPRAGVGNFGKFTYGLEGWGDRPDGSRLPAHNQVQSFVGGAMSHVATSPIDPVFWLHLAQVDRLWSLWQTEYPGFGPALLGPDQLLDPWPETADDVRSPLAIGYSYDL